ncbi:MAG: CoA transferase [Chloroflexi bacterium]|nr:CoA transferase [Chloroflexota bacterium]
MAASTPAAPLPLEGVRVLANATVWAGPSATLHLADLGAEVIEIESIRHMNRTRMPSRHIAPELMEGPTGALFVDRDASEGFWNRNANFNYGKRAHKSVTLDLTDPNGLELFHDLVRVSDVFLENNAADVVERLGIGYETLSRLNPRLVMGRFPGFGISGPYRNFKGYAPTMEAFAGHTYLRGYRDSDPSWTPGSGHGDPNAGAHMAFAIQAALFARERTGAGQLIDLSHVEAVLHHLAYAFMDYSMNRRVQGTWGNRHPSNVPNGFFPCAGEDEWIGIAVASDEAFAALAGAMGQPELAADPRFADVVSRRRHEDELEALVAEWTRRHPARGLRERLQAAGVPAAEVLPPEALRDDPHLLARGFWAEVEHPAAGRHHYPAPVAKLERHPLRIRGPAPLLGQHNEEVLKGLLGVSDARYEELIDRGVIGDSYLESAT